MRGNDHRTSTWRQRIFGLLQSKDLLPKQPMRTQQSRSNRGVTKHCHHRQGNGWLEEDLETAPRLARVVYGHHTILVGPTKIIMAKINSAKINRRRRDAH